MAVAAQFVNSTTAAVVLTCPLGRERPMFVTLLNNDAGIEQFVGGSAAVTAANGFRVKFAATTPVTVTLSPGDDLWAISASGTPKLSYFASN